jgi:hypothetical protein
MNTAACLCEQWRLSPLLMYAGHRLYVSTKCEYNLGYHSNRSTDTHAEYLTCIDGKNFFLLEP